MSKFDIRFHELPDSDDPLPRWLRQEYLSVVSLETKQIPESLRAVVSSDTTLNDWVQSVFFRNGWLVSAARATVELWRAHGYDGLLRMPVRAVEVSHYGIPGPLRIDLAYGWAPHRGQSWAQFRQLIMERVERTIEHYRQESIRSWGKQWKLPQREDLMVLARYQANEIKNPDESEYKRIIRTAKRLGLTLRPRNKRTKKS
jgi:hypothetical protein